MKFMPPLDFIVVMVLLYIGISYVLTGSKVGHPLRFAWCWVLDKLHLSYFWALMTCPPCNSWWVGFIGTTLIGFSLDISFVMAFITCGVTATIQGIAYGIGLGPEEDYNKLIPRRRRK
jgi:hypothetical protein